MTTQTIANRLVELCRQGKSATAYQELFSPNAVSIEPPKWNVPNTVGISALLEKDQKWQEDVVEIHNSAVSNPIVAGDFFTVSMSLDLTFTSRGRSQIEEICLYEVQDGKIVKEQFFH